MNRRLIANLNLMLLALVLAFFFWIIATEGENPTVEKSFPNPLPLEIRGLSAGMMSYGAEGTRVRVVLRAPQSVWNALQAEDIQAFVDLSNAGSGPLTAPIQVVVRRQPTRVVDVTPPEVTLTVEPVAQRELPVTIALQGTPALGYRTRPPTLAPQTVLISGPASIISQVTRLQVLVPVTDQRQEIRADFQPVPLDADGNTVSYVQTLPKAVTVQVPIEQLGNFRDLAVKVVLADQPAAGYRLTGVEVEPPIVTVFMRQEMIQSAPGYLETQPISLADASQDFTTTISLQVPDGLSVLTSSQVRVSVHLEALQSGMTLDLKPTVIGLNRELTATVAPEMVSVILSGPLPLLNQLGPDTLQLLLDLTGLPVGEHVIAPQIIAPDRIRIDSIMPQSVTVKIEPIGILNLLPP